MTKPNYYAVLTANVRYDSKLSADSKLLYAEITALCHAEGYCWASNGYFAGLYGVSTRAIQNRLRQLVNGGYIKVEVLTPKGNMRRITLAKFASPPHEAKFVTPHEDGFTHNNTSTNINYNKYLSLLNKESKRTLRVFPDKAKKQLNARLKEGFKIEDFENTIVNACKDDYHLKTKFKYVTFEYLTRSQTIEKYGFKTETKTEIKRDEYVR